MDIREALYTTRAMRRVTEEPIPDEVQAKILDAAIRAPSGGNGQQWRFLLVDDPDQRERLGELYRECIDLLWATIYADKVEAAQGEGAEAEGMRRMINSVSWAQENFARYPLLMFAFSFGDSSGGSIFPAVWSAQLAARAEGVGTSLTSVLAFKADETRELLAVPDDQWKMACCVTFGYPTGRWGVPARTPVQDVSYRNTWGTPVGLTVDEPLWP